MEVDIELIEPKLTAAVARHKEAEAKMLASFVFMSVSELKAMLAVGNWDKDASTRFMHRKIMAQLRKRMRPQAYAFLQEGEARRYAA